MIGFESLLSGSILGIFGSIGTSIFDYLKTREKNKHELAMMSAQKELENAKGANAVALEKEKNLVAAHESDKATYTNKEAMTGWTGLLFNCLMAVVDFLRGFTRPGLTWYFTILTTYFAIYAIYMIGFSDEFLKKVAEYSISVLLEMTCICGTWWFGSRGLEKLKQKGL